MASALRTHSTQDPLSNPGDGAPESRIPADPPHRTLPSLPPVVSDTLVGGFAGYAAVVVTVGVLDVVRGLALFHTPAVIGDWLFFGGVYGGAVAAAPVLVYNGLHLVASLAAAAVGSVVVHQAERTPGIWYLGLMLVLGGITLSLSILGGIGVEGRHLVDWWTVGAGTAAWFGALLVYFRWSHPGVLQAMEAGME